MTTLYRTPNLTLDAHEWHVAVELKAGRVFRRFRWRSPGGMWQPVTAWVGRKPKGLGERFKNYKKHILQAEGAEQRRAA